MRTEWIHRSNLQNSYRSTRKKGIQNSPVVLDLSNQSILVLGSRILRLDTLLLQVRRELLTVPSLVWPSNLVLPVIFDQVLQILTISRCRVGDVVIREPSLKFGLVPFVVDYDVC